MCVGVISKFSDEIIAKMRAQLYRLSLLVCVSVESNHHQLISDIHRVIHKREELNQRFALLVEVLPKHDVKTRMR